MSRATAGNLADHGADSTPRVMAGLNRPWLIDRERSGSVLGVHMGLSRALELRTNPYILERYLPTATCSSYSTVGPHIYLF